MNKAGLQNFRKILITLSICLIMAFFISLRSYYKTLESPELKMFELMYKLYVLTGRLYPSDDIALILIDRESENSDFFGMEWKDWQNDTYIFPLVNMLMDAQAKSIALTMPINQEDPCNVNFGNELPNAKYHLFLPSSCGGMIRNRDNMPILKDLTNINPLLAQNAKGHGFLGCLIDDDKICRYAQLAVKNESPSNQTGDTYMFSLTAQLVASYFGAELEYDNLKHRINIIRNNHKIATIPTNPMGQMLISFLPQEDADESPFLTRSIYDFFRDSQNAANLEIYKGKIVLIGLGQDVRGGNEYQRPNGQRINDILIQANILNTILSRNFICKWNQKQNMLCIILFSLILALLIILTDHKWKGNLARILLFSNLAIIVYLMLVAIMFFAYGYWINSVYPVLAMELSTISCTMFLGHEELKDRYYKLKIANEDLNKANIQVKEEEQKLLDAYDIIGKTYSEITGNNVPHNAEDIGASLHDIADHLYNSHHELLNFIDRASHDLRSPLVHIQNRLEISGGRLDESFPQVKKYIDQTSKLIEEILDISRIRAGKFEVNRIEDTQIKSAILSSAEFARSEAEKYGINLEYEIDKLPPLYADKQAIIRIINNILDNAIKFTPKGGNIRLIATDDEKSIRIQVHDSGTGIPSDILNRIFEPYFTTKPLNPISKGMGLGLAIVQKIVQLHDGAIKVESETGKGTAFTIMLPKQKDD